jgi:hypothetical protein
MCSGWKPAAVVVRGLATQDLDQGLQPLVVHVDLGDGRVHPGEGAVHHHDGVADGEVGHLDLLLAAARGVAGGVGGRDDGRSQHLLDLLQAQRHRRVRVAHESGDRRRVPDGGPGLVGELHPDQDVPGQDGALDLLALAVADLGDLFGGHHDLEDVVLHVQRGHPVLQVLQHPVLHAGVGVHHVPVAQLGAELAAEGLEGVGAGLRLLLVVVLFGLWLGLAEVEVDALTLAGHAALGRGRGAEVEVDAEVVVGAAVVLALAEVDVEVGRGDGGVVGGAREVLAHRGALGSASQRLRGPRLVG